MGVILKKKLNRGGVLLNLYERGGGLKTFSVGGGYRKILVQGVGV